MRESDASRQAFERVCADALEGGCQKKKSFQQLSSYSRAVARNLSGAIPETRSWDIFEQYIKMILGIFPWLETFALSEHNPYK